MAKLLIVLGIVFIGAGVALQAGVPLGRLPGDLVIRRGNTTFYVPIVTSLLASVLLSLVALVVRR